MFSSCFSHYAIVHNMAEYKFPLKNKFTVAEETEAFVFDTASAPDFTFRAGQYVDITLINPVFSGEKGNTHSFSIASSPNERGSFTIATRMDSPQRPISAYKKSLRALPIGAKVMVEGPYGMFTLHENVNKKGVFLAGGIGITPVRSIVKFAAENKLQQKIILIYSNRNSGAAVFLDELEILQKENPNFKLYAKMTDKSGYVDGEYVKGALGGSLSDAIYYVVGPPAMVQAFTKMLEAAGVSRDDMRFEEFSGY